MNTKKLLLLPLGALAFFACSSEGGEGNFSNNPKAEEAESSSSVVESSSEQAEPRKTIDYSKGRAMNAKIGRGINMGNTFDATCETCWGAGPVTLEQVKTIKAAGFNSIRLPVRWDREASDIAPYTITDTYLARVKEVVGWINGEGLVAIINMHHHQSFLEDMDKNKKAITDNDDQQIERVVEIWRQIAEYFKDVDNDKLVFELFNEPRGGVTPEAHNKMIALTHPVIRESNPDRTIMYGSNDYNAYTGIRKLKLPEDGNIIFTPHYYVPSNYALQGENYSCPENPKTWEATSSEIASMTNDFDNMVKLADEYFPGGLPINIGEFGATYCGGISSRVKWVTQFVKLAKEKGFSWNYWGFTNVGGYEIYDKKTQDWSDTLTLNALLK